MSTSSSLPANHRMPHVRALGKFRQRRQMLPMRTAQPWMAPPIILDMALFCTYPILAREWCCRPM
eukprot:3053628-Pyramimonas_sp.AAC.1